MYSLLTIDGSMTNPTLWLDLLVVAVCLGGLVFGVLCLRDDIGPRRGRLKLWATYCLGAAFLFLGCDTLLTRELADRSVATGVVTGLEKHGGKNSRSTFELWVSSSERHELHMDYAGPMLVSGERVRAEWMSFNGSVLRFDILSGVDEGHSIRSSTPFVGWISIALGAWLAFSAQKAWRRNPNAIPEKKRNGADGGVNQRSLLQLDGISVSRREKPTRSVGAGEAAGGRAPRGERGIVRDR